MKKLIVMLMVLVVCMTMLVGCSDRQSDRVSYNISQQADNFNVTRRLAVINARTDEPIFELIGNFSMSNSAYKELEIIVEVAPGQYKKHFVYLNEWTIYVVEDVSGAYVDQYHYEVNFLPEMIIPVTFISED
jgi:uncharacterized lipoprotein NlpE involved in copper resistance